MRPGLRVSGSSPPSAHPPAPAGSHSPVVPLTCTDHLSDFGCDFSTGRGSGYRALGCWRRQLGSPQLSTEPQPHFLGWPVAWYKREFLALPVMGAGMTAMWVTPGLGTQVPDSTGAGKQTGRLAEGFPRNPGPPLHGPGSQARCVQGQEGLGVPCLRFCGDCQEVGHYPPSSSYYPEPHALANASVSTSHRGEFPEQPVPL